MTGADPAVKVVHEVTEELEAGLRFAVEQCQQDLAERLSGAAARSWIGKMDPELRELLYRVARERVANDA